MNYGRAPRHMVRVRADRNGAFTVADLPAGEYLVAAVREDTMPESWTDPVFLRTLAASAASVRVTAGAATTAVIQTSTVR